MRIAINKKTRERIIAGDECPQGVTLICPGCYALVRWRSPSSNGRRSCFFSRDHDPECMFLSTSAGSMRSNLSASNYNGKDIYILPPRRPTEQNSKSQTTQRSEQRPEEPEATAREGENKASARCSLSFMLYKIIEEGFEKFSGASLVVQGNHYSLLRIPPFPKIDTTAVFYGKIDHLNTHGYLMLSTAGKPIGISPCHYNETIPLPYFTGEINVKRAHFLTLATALKSKKGNQFLAIKKVSNSYSLNGYFPFSML